MPSFSAYLLNKFQFPIRERVFQRVIPSVIGESCGVASSPINNYDIVAVRLNALINVIGPISDHRWLSSHPPLPLPIAFTNHHLARLSGRLLCRKLRGTRSKRRRKSQFISFQAGRAAGDRDSDFPPSLVSVYNVNTGPNDAWKSIVSISRIRFTRHSSVVMLC